MRIRVERESLVPAGAAKVADKSSDAVAFVYVTAANRPAAMVFQGRKARPAWHRVYRDEAARERDVARFFEVCRTITTRRAERRGEAAKPHGLMVGHVMLASWGYDQTNINFYQVTAIVGRCMVEVRAIAQADASTGCEPWATCKALPALDAFTGEPMRKRVDGKRQTVRIDDCRTAGLWDGTPQSWTAYA